MSTDNFLNQTGKSIKDFYTKYRKVVNIAAISIVAIAGLIAFLSIYWMPQREKAAATKLSKLHHYFETDSFAVVVNGIKGKKMATAPEIADDYSFTKKGKEAALMAGLSYMHLSKWEKAEKYLSKANSKDLILGPSILAAKATCYSEMNKPDKAAAAFEKAGDMGKNDFTVQYYKKAGIHYEKAGELKKALRCYEIIKSEYSKTEVGSDIDKYIYKVKGLLGELNN
ncbi:MAG: tetratricopeptide repeat protein [Bacteroidia bacterium]|jgi:tetratricopeptide (TPR) repeat protein|nr:tetratricopeptide repeat protein [Bacteroidia bacterium]